jgi:hypothetical protein
MARKKEEKSQAPKKPEAVKSQKKGSAVDKNIPDVLRIAFTISRLVVVLVAVIVMGLSYFSGAGYIDILLRTGTAVLLVGFILWFINMRLARGSLDAVLADLEEIQKSTTELSPLSTVEKKA